MDKIEQDIINIILSHPPLRAIDIANNLKMSRQKTEYHLQKMVKQKLLIKVTKHFSINFNKYFETQTSLHIRHLSQIEQFINYLFKTVAVTRGYFIEPLQRDTLHEKRRIEYDMLLDRLFNNRDIVYEGIADEDILDIFKHYPKEELEKQRERLFVLFGLPKEFFIFQNTYSVFGDYLIEMDDIKQELKVQRNKDLCKLVEMTVKIGKHFGKRIQVQEGIENIKNSTLN